MYIKTQTRMTAGTDGKKQHLLYHRLYESYRDGNGKVRQHYLLPLYLDDLPSWKDRREMCRLLNDMVVNGPILEMGDTEVSRKAIYVYSQLQSKGLLGGVRKVEEKTAQ